MKTNQFLRLKWTIWILSIFGILSLNAQEYPLMILEEGHLLVEVKLSDSITGNFILDTGAGANVLSANMFKKVSSDAKRAGYFTGFRHDGDRLDGEVYTIPSLAIGEVTQKDPVVGVYPPLDAMGIDGLLSLKFFEDKPFTIDFVNGKLIFLNSEEVKGLTPEAVVLPISVYQHTNVSLDIFIPIQLNDRIDMLAEFDTGSGFGSYIINPGYIKELDLDPSLSKTQPYVTQLSGESRVDTIYELKSISMGEELMEEDVAVIFREGLIYNALIGSGMFRDRKVTIDIPNRNFIVHN